MNRLRSNQLARRSAVTGLALVVGMFSIILGAQTILASGVVESPVFNGKKLNDAVRKLVGKASINRSEKVIISSASIAEDASKVGIGVSIKGLKNVQSITLFAADNTQPLIARFKIYGDTTSFVKSRVKLRKSTKVVAIIKAGGRYYSSSKEVKITDGGCGG